MAMAVAACALLMVSCGGGGGDTLPINGITDANTLSALSPAVVVPPTEYYKNIASPNDPLPTQWLKNVYQPIPNPANPTGVYQNSSLAVWADEIYRGINASRSAAGLNQLIRVDYLDALAQAQARDMALRNYFSHSNPEGMQVLQRLLALNPPGFNHLGENAAKGQESPTEVITQWNASPGHRANVVGSSYLYTGVGVYYDPNDPTMPMHIVQVYVEFYKDPSSYSGWEQPGRLN